MAPDAVHGLVQQKFNNAVMIGVQNDTYGFPWVRTMRRTELWAASAVKGSDMPLITGCKLYVDEKLTAMGYSLEATRRRAVPYIHNQRALKIESFAAAAPTQVWAYDYDIEAWVLQRSLVANDVDRGHSLCCNAIATRQP